MSAQLPDTSTAGRPVLTIRTAVIGLVMCVLIGVSGPYWTVYLKSSRMYEDYHAAGVVFGIFLLAMIFNLALGRLVRPLRLRADELRGVGALMFMASSVATMGLVSYWISAISGPFYFASASNGWTDELLPRLPRALFPIDPGGTYFGVRKFWTGVPSGEPIPWGPWIGPLLTWGVFFVAFLGAMMAAMVIMRKQWVDYEHLSFPVAQVPAELCHAADSQGQSHILQSPAFWVAGGLTFLLTSMGGIGLYLKLWSEFRIRHTVTGLGPLEMPLYVDIVVAGLVFLIPNRIAFTVWFFALASWMLDTFMTSYNFKSPGGGVYGEEMAHLAMGGCIVFALISLWLSRGHLVRAWRCAFGKGEQGYDAGEAASYRTALLVMVIGFAFSVAWWVHFGLLPHVAVVLMLAVSVIFYTTARVVAQCGLPVTSPPIQPSIWTASLFGTGALGKDQVALFGANTGWFFDVRGNATVASSHAQFLTSGRRGGLLWAMLAAVVVTTAVAAVATIRLGYRIGGANLDPYLFDTYPRYIPWAWTGQAMANVREVGFVPLIWGCAGALLMAGLMVAQRTMFWWPLHPVGLLIVSSHMVRYFWASVFVAWLAKYLIVKFGGYGAFKIARRVAIGAVVGTFVAGGMWAIIDTITGGTGQSVFYI